MTESLMTLRYAQTGIVEANRHRQQERKTYRKTNILVTRPGLVKT